MDGPLTTSLTRSWLIKTSVVTLVFLGLGVWGLYDALVSYPARGVESAEHFRYKYLKEAKADSGSNDLTSEKVKVADPKADFEKLSDSNLANLRPREQARYQWLEALAYVGKLRPEETAIPTPEMDLAALTAKWSGGTPPKPLTKWDIPSQWAITAVGVFGGALGLWIIVKTWSQVYKFDPARRVLTLPDGTTLSTEDVEDFDRRKWDKFIMFVRVKASHATLGGRELKLDLLRHTPLEDWVVDMEYALFPDRKPKDEDEAPADGPPAAAETTEAEGS